MADSFLNTHKKPSSEGPHKHKQPSTTELFSSAKYVAEAAKASLGNESDKVDKAKVAGAAADLLGAASHYGKLEEKSFGKYVEKAEDYLHQYHSSHSNSTTTSSAHSQSGNKTNKSKTEHSGSGGGNSQGHSGPGFGDYFKLAEGFLKKK